MTNNLCSFEDCEKNVKSKGLCTGHYQQQLKGLKLSPLGMRDGRPLSQRNIEDFFWARVDKTCDHWIWTGGITVQGYGFMQFGGTRQLAHRYSYTLHNEEIPEGLSIDHLCHVRRCVNPDHLRSTTHKENMENRRGANTNSKSRIRGVRWDKERSAWRTEVRHEGKTYSAGRFENLDEAARAVAKLRKSLFNVTN